MVNAIKVKALRLALQTAKAEYAAHPGDSLAGLLTYLAGKIRPPRPEYPQLAMFAVAGRPNGKYHCMICKRNFGENEVSRLQSKRAYLTLHCPHCGRCWYEDRSQ